MTAILGISAFYHDSAAAIVIDGKTINVNEGGKTENNVSHPPAMVPNGTTGQLARGGGYMGVDYF